MTEQKGTFEERQILSQLDEELKDMNRRLTVLKNGEEQELPAGGTDEDL